MFQSRTVQRKRRILNLDAQSERPGVAQLIRCQGSSTRHERDSGGDIAGRGTVVRYRYPPLNREFCIPITFLTDVYRDAAKHNVIVVGGSARTVGAAGGYLTGGGHSVFSHFYGLAADSKLVFQCGRAN
jgi:hypothetical protein